MPLPDPQPPTPNPRPRITVIIPVFNEAAAIGRVVDEIPAGLAAQVLVIDGGSTDGTQQAAEADEANRSVYQFSPRGLSERPVVRSAVLPRGTPKRPTGRRATRARS